MRLKIAILFLLCCINSYAVNISWTIVDGTQVPITNHQVYIQPFSVPTATNTSIAIGGKLPYTTDNTGTFISSNMVVNCLWQCQVVSPPTQQPFYILLPPSLATNTNTLYATAYLSNNGTNSVFPYGSYGWSAYVSDQRYINTSNSVPNGYTIYATNGTYFWAATSGGGGITNIATTTTNGLMSSNYVQTLNGAITNNNVGSITLNNVNNAFTGTLSGVAGQVFNGALQFTGTFVGVGSGAFAGDGSALTNLSFHNAITNGQTNVTLSGTITGNGAGLSNIVFNMSPNDGSGNYFTDQNPFTASSNGVLGVTHGNSIASLHWYDSSYFLPGWNENFLINGSLFIGDAVNQEVQGTGGYPPSVTYFNGNPTNAVIANLGANAVQVFVNMNPWSSGSGTSSAYVTTNAAEYNPAVYGSRFMTNINGTPVYLADLFAISRMFVPSPSAGLSDSPRMALDVLNSPTYPYMLGVANPNGMTGNYPYTYLDPTNDVLYLMPAWSQGGYFPWLPGFTNSLAVYQKNGTISVRGGITNGGVYYGNGAGLTNVGGTSLTSSNNSLLQATTPVVATTNLPAATYPGQMLMTYGSGIGGSSAGQLFFAGNDLGWRNGMQFGHMTAYSTQFTEALLAVVSNNLDNCITLQNLNSNHYSAMRFLDNYGAERGAVGWGNTNAPYYQGINYNEDDAAGWYYASGGNIYGGKSKNGHFRWYAGNATTDTNSTVVFDVDLSGNLAMNGSLTLGNSSASSVGFIATTSAGTVNFVNMEGANAYLNGLTLDPNQGLAFTNLTILQHQNNSGIHQISFANGYFFCDVDNSYNWKIGDSGDNPLLTLNGNGASSVAKFGGGGDVVTVSAQAFIATNGINTLGAITNAMTPTGYTNSSGVEQKALNVTGVSVIFHDSASGGNFSLGTITTPTLLLFRNGDYVTGTSMAAVCILTL